MGFVTDKEQLKPGLIIFRRADVDHRNWYCRIKLPKVDRYKTISLKTPDVLTARERAFEEDSELRFRLKHNVPVFNRSFSEVGEEYAKTQEQKAAAGQISDKRAKAIRWVIERRLNLYVGANQVHLVGHDKWQGYPIWRRGVGQGRVARFGSVRPLTAEETADLEAKATAKAEAVASRPVLRRRKATAPPAEPKKQDKWVFVSDDTVRWEMVIFKAVMEYAATKRYIAPESRFGNLPDFKKNRRDEFTPEEYRRLHTKGRAWIKKTGTEFSALQRTIAYNFILVMCNTGMRPPEASNLRWRDITSGIDREGRQLVVLHVRGKDKERKLVAPQQVGEYLDRIKALSKSTQLEDAVFTNHDGTPAEYLYGRLVEDLLDFAELRVGPSGAYRSTYCFRHTYATFRLSEGVDAYLLAEQMGTSVKMLQEHYGHVNTIKHADLVLHGMSSWEPVTIVDEQAEGDEKRALSSAARSKSAPPLPKRRGGYVRS